MSSLDNELTENKKKRLLDMLNKAIKELEPIPVSSFNSYIYTGTSEKSINLENIEKDYPELGIRKLTQFPVTGEDCYGMSTLSIIATVTDVLCGARLAVNVNEQGYIVGFSWYSNNEN